MMTVITFLLAASQFFSIENIVCLLTVLFSFSTVILLNAADPTYNDKA